jgi:cholesterol transport system auxiliary component
VLLACLCLSGCSGLFHSDAKPDQVYYLRAPASPAAGAAMPVSLRVARPQAGPGLATSRIMLVQADRRMNFYSGSRWPAPAPELLEALAVQTLRASGDWASVQDSGSPFPSDYLLQFHLRRFEAEYTEGVEVPTAHALLDCTVGRRQGHEILATFTAEGSAAASANRLSAVIPAFEQATGMALNSLAQQAAQAVRSDLQRAAPTADNPPPAGKP